MRFHGLSSVYRCDSRNLKIGHNASFQTLSSVPFTVIWLFNLIPATKAEWCAMTKEANRRIHTVGLWLQFQASGICDEQSIPQKSSLLVPRSSLSISFHQCSILIAPVSIIPPMLHTYLPCQYHSTNAPYLSPLSVSFHQCSILISAVSIIPPMLHTHLPCQYHSTNAPYLSPLSVSFHQCSILISPVSIIPPMLHTNLPCQYHSTSAPYLSPLSVSFHQCSVLISPVNIIPPMLHTHLLCQYHSTNAPYSFNHLSPTPYHLVIWQ